MKTQLIELNVSYNKFNVELRVLQTSNFFSNFFPRRSKGPPARVARGTAPAFSRRSSDGAARLAAGFSSRCACCTHSAGVRSSQRPASSG